MQKGRNLYFSCQKCHKEVNFSLFDIKDVPIQCACGTKYTLDDPVLKRQLQKFESLCKQICESEEILDNTSIGIDFNGKQVLVPYRLLLTRLTPRLDLFIGEEKLTIKFRLEPRKDYQ